MTRYCCQPVLRNPWCVLDTLYHRLVFKVKREVYIPGINWICDRHEHNMTGISMTELRHERQRIAVYERAINALTLAP